MMDNLFKKLKEYMKTLEDKKFINHLLIILIITVGLLFIIKNFTNKSTNIKSPVLNEEIPEYNNEVNDYSNLLERKLSNILSKIEGAGRVNVMITLEDSVEKVPALNTNKTSETTKEVDSEGGTRDSSREDESKQLINISNDIVILKEKNPNIKGVIVVAEGAEDPLVLENMYSAVKTVLGISANRVQVYKSK